MKFDNIIKKVPSKELFPARFAKPGIQPGFVNGKKVSHSFKGTKLNAKTVF